MKIYRAVILSALICALALPSWSQDQSGAQGGAGAQQEQGKKAGSLDQRFVREAAQGGMAEVELGNLAQQKAQSDEVKQFAQRMVTDHGKANDELKQLASQKGWESPTDMGEKHKAERDKLDKMSGAEFDKAYMSHMVMDHQKDVSLFRRASRRASDAELKGWAGKTLPVLQDHLKQATDTAKKVGAPMPSMKRGKSKGAAAEGDQSKQQ